MRILHIGSFTSQHTLMAGLAYKMLEFEVVFFNTQKKTNQRNVNGLHGNFKFVNPYDSYEIKKFTSVTDQIILIKSYLGKYDPKIVKELKQIALENEFDFVIGTWGFTTLEVMLVCQKIFHNAKFLHNVLTIPDLPIETIGFKGFLWKKFDIIFTFIQNQAYKKMLLNCDVRVFATEEMSNYVKRKYGPFEKGIDILRIELFNKCFFPKNRKEKLSNIDGEPHIAHIGATNFAAGMEIDNVSDSLIKISNNKINIHLNANVAPPELIKANSNYLHYFEKFTTDSEKSAFSEFLTQFDAIVILYNVRKVYKRFEFSLPTRFLFALVTGIPIVIPARLFPACEKYITKHEIGFAYKDEEELYLNLTNKHIMNKFSNNAILHSLTLDFESNSTMYLSILNDSNYN